MSKGNITLNNIRAEKNSTGYETILLDNCLEDSITNLCQGSGSVSILNSLGPNIIMNNNATSASLSIFSHGTVTLNGVVDDYNQSGATVRNVYGTAAVTISKSSFSRNSSAGGLNVLAAGKITLTSVNASYNFGPTGFGASLMNLGAPPNTPAPPSPSAKAFSTLTAILVC